MGEYLLDLRLQGVMSVHSLKFPDIRVIIHCIVTMAMVPVKVCLNGSCKMITTYAFLDPASNVSFITENLRHNLGCEGKHLKINLGTMGVNTSVTDTSVTAAHTYLCRY